MSQTFTADMKFRVWWANEENVVSDLSQWVISTQFTFSLYFCFYYFLTSHPYTLLKTQYHSGGPLTHAHALRTRWTWSDIEMQVRAVCFPLWFLSSFSQFPTGPDKDLLSQKNPLVVTKLQYYTRHCPSTETDLGFPLQ